MIGRGGVALRYISFAQEYEDIILYSALKDYVQEGFYVDIGANDPSILSVTKLFYDLGWRGINIEPLDDMYELLCRERKEDININVGISDQNGELELAVNGELSSFCNMERSSEKVVKQVSVFKDIWQKVTSSSKINEVHFCKIDVEGYERNVLLGIDFEAFRPWIFCIESASPGTKIPCHDKWENILLTNGYVCVFQKGINRYYIDKDKEFLTEGFTKFKKMFVDHEIWQVTYRNNDVLNRRWLEKHKSFTIFGAGNFLHNFVDTYGTKYKPLAIVDNSKYKQGNMVLGMVVDSPAILRGYNSTPVLICCKETMEIRQQLEKMGITDYKNYHFVQQYIVENSF